MHQFARLTDQERQQQRARHREQQAEARARLTDQERHQQRARLTRSQVTGVKPK